MARKLRESVAIAEAEKALEGDLTVKTKIKNPTPLPDDAVDPGDKAAPEKRGFLPYNGRDSLPECKKDSKGKVIGKGDSRYMFQANDKGGGDLLEIYRKHNGVGRKLVRTLNNKNPKHKAYRMALRNKGIPGA